MKNQPVLIRPYTPADYSRCLAIFNSNVPKFFTPGEAEDYARWLSGLGELPTHRYDKGELHYFVAEQSGSVLACGGWGIREGADHATLVWGAVDNEYHRLGIGHALTEFRISNFRQHYPSFPLTIDTSHHTAPFYEHFGFRTEKFTENGYAPGLHRHDMRLH